MTERELLCLQLAKYYPEDESLSQDSLESMGVNELRRKLRKCHAALHLGELNVQFREWIVANEKEYCDKIQDVLKRSGNHKVKLTYYGIIYNILEHMGCYLKGKNGNPIGITRVKYCKLLNLSNRLRSNNVRKAIATAFYNHNYMMAIACRENGELLPQFSIPEIVQMEPIAKQISNEVKHHFFSR